jgi:hypothetical protein
MTGFAPFKDFGIVTRWDVNIADREGGPRFEGENTRQVTDVPLYVSQASGTHLAPETAVALNSALGPFAPQGVLRTLTPLEQAIASDNGLPTALDDIFFAAPWDGRIDGQGGWDTVIFDDYREMFDISPDGEGWQVRHAAKDYAITVENIEKLQFRDATLLWEM